MSENIRRASRRKPDVARKCRTRRAYASTLAQHVPIGILPHTPATEPPMSDAPAPPRSSMRVIILASFIGTAIEWYDFFLYGTAAALVFNRLFFPTLNPLAGTLSSYGTFAVGFVARP